METDRKTMLDRLLVDQDWVPIFRPQARGAIEERARYMPLLESAVCFDIGNVYDYCIQEHVYTRYYADREISMHGKVDDAELFVCAPQFPVMWMEYTGAVGQAKDGGDSKVVISKPTGTPHDATVGWLLRTIDCKNEHPGKLLDMSDAHGEHVITDDTRWVIGATQWQRYRKLPDGRKGELTTGPSYTVLLTVDEQGRLQKRFFAPYWNRDAWDPAEMPMLNKSDWADVFSKWVPVQFALTFMNCRNVRHEIVKPSPKLSRAHQRRHGGPGLVEYRQLVLDLSTDAVSRHTDGAIHSASRLHICRGHFRVYTAEKPLFGHYVGPVWVPAHLRGSASEGTLVKDYFLKGAGEKPD